MTPLIGFFKGHHTCVVVRINIFQWLNGGFHKCGIPKMVGFLVENLIKMNDLGASPVQGKSQI